MKYLKFIFENESVCNFTDINQPIIEVATQAAIYNSILIEEDVSNNLESFISSESGLVDVYESIKDYTISKSIEFYDLVNEIISDPVLTMDQKVVVLSEIEAVIPAEVPAVIPPVEIPKTSMSILTKAISDEKALIAANAAKKYHAMIANADANPSHAALAALATAGLGAAAYHGINKYRNRNNF